MTTNAAPAADRVPVLMYHRIDEDVAPESAALCVTPRRFAAHLAWLADHGWRPCTVRAFDDWFQGRAGLPPRSVLISFDDGFEGLHTHALPLLAARGWPAVVFLVSGLIGQCDAWTAREFGSAGAHPLLGRAQIAEMQRHGFDFQSHSRSHPDLAQLGGDELVQQISGSREELQSLLGTPVDYFAYPFGRHSPQVRSAVLEAGYRLAFSVAPGFNRPGGAAFELRRLDITGRDSAAAFGRKVALGSNDGSMVEGLRYLGGRVAARLLRSGRPG